MTKGRDCMKKLLSLVLVMVCVMSMLGCNLKSDAGQNQAGEFQKEDINTQYFFSAKVLEVDDEYLLLEVFYTGNSSLSNGARVEVLTNVVAAGGCPEFVVDEYARVVMARDTDGSSSERLNALAIYKTDETGNVTAD